MATKYNWTTGPISSSMGLDNTRVVVLNNTSLTRKAYVRLYDLSFTPKKRVLNKELTLSPYQTKEVTVDATGIEFWEAQLSAYSKSVRGYVAGREGSRNLCGNTVLNAQFKMFGT